MLFLGKSSTFTAAYKSMLHIKCFFRMVTCQEKALEQMKLGLFDVLPSGSLDSLTSEDFRLLLNGVRPGNVCFDTKAHIFKSFSLMMQVGDINVQTLISYTSFNDECGESPDRLVAFKRWLWAIVEKMSPVEKQDLIFFWTGESQ